MSFSQFTQKDIELIRRDAAELMEAARKRCADEEEFKVVQKAFDFANEAHKNVRRRSGEPYMLHPIAVAKIVVCDIGLGYKSISAALLHDVVEDTNYTIEDITNLFGEKIASLVDGLTKMKTMLDNENRDYALSPESLQAENFKRILLTLNDDVRVALIKLADRLHNCRTIEYMPEHKRDKILSETMFIFIPLAHRLGLYEIKSEMENIWLRYKEPEAYNDICSRIESNVEATDDAINSFIAPIESSLKDAGFNFSIKKRIKTPYSIWHKMKTKNVTFDQVYDLYAVRIIFTPSQESTESERDQCYHIFSIITGIYRYQPERVRDWVKHPKSNGYEALHCTLMSPMGKWVEVQIRTKRMDDIAEKGIAAHWTYKKEGYTSESGNDIDQWLAKVKEILVQRDDISALELLDIIHDDLTGADIVVFTPKGEQKTMPSGSTALDFAYQIHTHIGHKAIAAKVNMKLVPLSHTLRSGDQVEIITAENGKPKTEWLQFLRTRHALNVVLDWFRDQSETLVPDGARLFNDILRVSGLKPTNDILKKVLLATQLPYVDELYFRIAVGLIEPEKIVSILTDKESTVAPKSTFMVRSKDKSGRTLLVASCCCPIPGDAVVGFKAPDGSITIHKKSCKVAENIASKHGDWVVEVPKWDTVVDGSVSFPVRITLKGIDRVGLLSDISHYISQIMGVNIRRLNIGAQDGLFDGYIEMSVGDKRVLDQIVDKLRSIEGIQSIVRTDI